VLNITNELLEEYKKKFYKTLDNDEIDIGKNFIIKDLSKLYQLKSVLDTGGHFDGFNRKI